MASSEKSSSRSGIGWLPKLFLWSAVIAFGYVYLTSVDREGGSISASALLESVAKLSPIPISALPGFSKSEDKADEHAAATVVEGDSTAPKSAEPKPVTEAESAVFAKSLMKEEAVAEKPAATAAPEVKEAAKPAPVTVQAPATYAAAATHKPDVVESSAPAPTQAPPASAVASSETPAATPSQAASPSPAPAAVAAEPTQGSMPSSMPSDWAPVRQQHDQMVARYEAMRREADERMRQYWERMREAAPAAGPYGYPAYAPGYAPGFYPPTR